MTVKQFLTGLVLLLCWSGHAASTLGIRASSAAVGAALTNETTAAALSALGGVAKAGDTMTGTLEVPDLAVTGTGSYSNMVVTNDLVVGSALSFPGKMIDVKEFGATGDGVTSDATALQNAADYCMTYGRTLYLSPGTYRFTSSSEYIDVTGNLKVVGSGKLSTLQHYTNATVSTTFFRLGSGGANLDVQSVQFDNAKYGVLLASGHNEIESIRLVDITSTNTAYTLWAQQTISESQNRLKNILVQFCTHYGLAEQFGALVWLDSVPWGICNVINNQIYGGSEGVYIGPDDFPMDMNPLTYCGKVNVQDNLFQEIGHTTSASRALRIFAFNPLVQGNLFKQVHNTAGASADYFPVYGYMMGGLILGNTFDRCGYDGSSKATMVFKGASLNVDYYNTNTIAPTIGYNHPGGWGVTVQDNLFIDDPDNPTQCGRIDFDTDYPRLIGNKWIQPTAANLIVWQPSSTSYDERGGIVCRGNIVTRGTANTLLYVRTPGASTPVDGIIFENNEWHDRNSSVANYFLDVLYATYNTRIVGNKLWNCTNSSIARLGTAVGSATSHRGVLFADNYITNGTYGLFLSSTAAANDPGHALIDATIERNVLDQNNGAVLYIASKGQAIRLKMRDNVVTNQYGTVYGKLRLGTAPTYVYDMPPTQEAVNYTGSAIAAGPADFTDATGWDISGGGFAIETGGDGYLQSLTTTTAGYCRIAITEPPMQRLGVLWSYSIEVTTNTAGISLRFGSSVNAATIAAETTGTQTGTVFVTNPGASQYLTIAAVAADGEIGIDSVQITPAIETLAAFQVPAGSMESDIGQIFKWDAALQAAGDANIDLIWSDGSTFTRILNGQLLPMSSACNEASLFGSLAYKTTTTGVAVSRLTAFDNSAGTNITRGYSYSAVPGVTWASERGWLLVVATNAADSAVTYMSGSTDFKTP